METTDIIAWGGFLIIVILVFAETGLLVGLVIPGGETLVFTAGFLVSTASLEVPIALLLSALITAGLCGDASGYYIGRRFGRKLHQTQDTWYFRKEYLEMTEAFFARHSKAAFIFGKFLPVVRPFIPVVSGLAGVRFPSFVLLSVVACVLYMSTFVLSGYFLGSRFPILKEYIGWILPISITLALISVALQIRSHRRKGERSN